MKFKVTYMYKYESGRNEAEACEGEVRFEAASFEKAKERIERDLNGILNGVGAPHLGLTLWEDAPTRWPVWIGRVEADWTWKSIRNDADWSEHRKASTKKAARLSPEARVWIDAPKGALLC